MFIKNEAENGGGIKIIKNLPVLNNGNKFMNNIAIYGEDLASYPIRVALESFDKSKKNNDINHKFRL